MTINWSAIAKEKGIGECPFCGAGLDPEEPDTHYSCGTAKDQDPEIYRYGSCYEVEIANLKAQVQDQIEENENLSDQVAFLMKRLEAWRKVKPEVYHLLMVKAKKYIYDPRLIKLKTLKEI